MSGTSDNPDLAPEKAPKPGKQHEQAKLDDALDDTFPASDPPSQTDPTKGKIISEDPVPPT